MTGFLVHFRGAFVKFSLAPIAQLVEQLPFKEWVVGSTPTGRTTKSLHFSMVILAPLFDLELRRAFDIAHYDGKVTMDSEKQNPDKQ